MVAHGPWPSLDTRERLLAGPLAAYTRATPATPARLRAALAEVRQQGYAYCPGYVHEEALGVAAPVRGADGQVVAALSALVPNDAGAQAVLPVVRTAARGVSRALGAPTVGPYSPSALVPPAGSSGATRPDFHGGPAHYQLRAENDVLGPGPVLDRVLDE
ncbi:hypothetical protein KBY55_18265 [Streptomyces sp. b94]|uniref:IclR family transcriptional regulator domain-containing protein n=1 Tax=Streptomyces sp. b94 TaxID=1827634 RepID=UPI001B35A334|nr:IclR family transcriptional regulator C-terminal domain-containing protein [Streptomyces sp. b94]MBQ1097976.1 hypothetical protein [Streptomyces sp. b94]